MPKYSNAQFLKAIPDSAGIISTVASRVGCSWDAANKRIKKSPVLRKAFNDEQERVNDLAEATVIKSIKDGNTQDAKWWLARIRRDRFSERTEHTGAGGGTIPVETGTIDDWRKERERQKVEAAKTMEAFEDDEDSEDE